MSQSLTNSAISSEEASMTNQLRTFYPRKIVRDQALKTKRVPV